MLALHQSEVSILLCTNHSSPGLLDHLVDSRLGRAQRVLVLDHLLVGVVCVEVALPQPVPHTLVTLGHGRAEEYQELICADPVSTRG